MVVIFIYEEVFGHVMTLNIDLNIGNIDLRVLELDVESGGKCSLDVEHCRAGRREAEKLMGLQGWGLVRRNEHG